MKYLAMICLSCILTSCFVLDVFKVPFASEIIEEVVEETIEELTGVDVELEIGESK